MPGPYESISFLDKIILSFIFISLAYMALKSTNMKVKTCLLILSILGFLQANSGHLQKTSKNHKFQDPKVRACGPGQFHTFLSFSWVIGSHSDSASLFFFLFKTRCISRAKSVMVYDQRCHGMNDMNDI
jgi:hypothetical protein